MALERYFLGCPIWSFKGWTGALFRANARPAEYLSQYASVFNTVEGNTTFYALPSEESVARWQVSVPPGFEFCFKIPQWITHGKRLRGAEAETEVFLTRMAPLGARLGPFLLQLPPGFGPADVPALGAYLRRLPAAYRFVVEVRHPAFFDGEQVETALNARLQEWGVDRAIFDTRALRTADPVDPAVAGAQRRKPDLPVRLAATGSRPFYRFVAHPDVPTNRPWLAALADVVAGWLAEGRTPYVFMHSPYDIFAPELGREFHWLLSQRLPVGAMPPWPGETNGEEPTPDAGGQLRLFPD